MRRLAPIVPFVVLASCNGPDPSLFCESGGGTCAAVATTTATGSALGSLNVDTQDKRLGVDTLDAHVFMRVHDSELYVVQEDSGAIRIYDPKTLGKKVELTLGDATHPAATSHPRDFWVDDDNGNIWVTLSGNPAAAALAIVRRDDPGVVTYVGMPQAADDPDGKPEADLIRSCNTKLYVTLKGSYTDGSGATQYVRGRIGISDPNKHIVWGVIPLAGKNPVSFVHIEGDCNQGIVATAGSAAVLDGLGTVERFDLDKGASRGVLLGDQQLMGQPQILATGGGHRMYIAATTASSGLMKQRVIAFDWKTETILGDVTDEVDQVSSLVQFNGHVYAGTSSGLFVADDDATKAGAPLDIGGASSALALP